MKPIRSVSIYNNYEIRLQYTHTHGVICCHCIRWICDTEIWFIYYVLSQSKIENVYIVLIQFERIILHMNHFEFKMGQKKWNVKFNFRHFYGNLRERNLILLCNFFFVVFVLTFTKRKRFNFYSITPFLRL